MGAEPQLGYLVLNLCARDYSHLCFLAGLVAESVVQHQGDQPNPAMCFSCVSFHWICPPTISMQIHFRIPNISVLLEVRFAICCHWKAFEIPSFFQEGGAGVSLGLCFQVSVSSFASKINAMYSVTSVNFLSVEKHSSTFLKQSKRLLNFGKFSVLQSECPPHTALAKGCSSCYISKCSMPAVFIVKNIKMLTAIFLSLLIN